MAVLQYVWEVIAAMPNLEPRHYWMNRVTDAFYARNPNCHRDYYWHGVMGGVRDIRLKKGLPV